MKKTTTIVIVENAFRKSAIKQFLFETKIAQTIEFKSSLLECMSGTCQPAFLIIDSELLPEPHQVSLDKIKQKNSDCKILLLHHGAVDTHILPYIDGHIQFFDSEEEILHSFRTFFTDEKHPFVNKMVDNTLSERELEVVKLVALGKTNKEISDALYISAHTVVSHRKKHHKQAWH
jgi:DNA-binding NarL/FixJ family response regulator